MLASLRTGALKCKNAIPISGIPVRSAEPTKMPDDALVPPANRLVIINARIAPSQHNKPAIAAAFTPSMPEARLPHQTHPSVATTRIKVSFKADFPRESPTVVGA